MKKFFNINRFREKALEKLVKALGVSDDLRYLGQVSIDKYRRINLVDPDEVRFELAGTPYQELIKMGTLPQKAIWGMEKDSPLLLRKLEPLLYGGGKEGPTLTGKNLVVDQGIEHMMDVALSVGTQVTFGSFGWYVGVLGTYASQSVVAGDTYASHAGWSENTNTSESRVTTGDVAISSKQWAVSSKVFTFNADTQLIGGAVIVGGNSTGVQTAGNTAATGAILLCGKVSASDKGGDTNDTVTVTYTLTGSSS